MPTNLQQFNKEVAKLTREMPARELILVQKKIVLQMLRGVMEKTPVNTGRARNGWQITITAVPEESGLDMAIVGEGQSFDKAPPLSVIGQARFTEQLTHLSKLGPFQVVFVSNNVEYISYLDEGSSDQAPEGMTELTMAELLEMFK